MEILDLGSNGDDKEQTVRKKGKSLTAAIGVGGVAAITGLGSTFAANISLNNDQAVEFGQGVTQTVACDSDGFTINPVTRYDNTNSKFRIDYVEITGIDLTPQGTGYGEGGYETSTAAITAHPGQYYGTKTVNGSAVTGWHNTCDGVVLDFKAYTDSNDFSNLTVSGDTSTALYWSQGDSYAGSGKYNSSIAVLVNSRENYTNYGSDDSYDNISSFYVNYDLNNQNSKIKLQNWDQHYDSSAQAVNKFTVESMPDFPSGYLTFYEDSGSYYTARDYSYNN